MSLVVYKILAGIVIFITSILSVAYPLKVRARPTHHRFLELGDAFASGIFLGAALFHMLPDATKGFVSALGNINYPLAEFFCAAGFLLLLFFERLSTRTSVTHQPTSIPYSIAIIIIIHSLIEGAALGINTTFATASIIFLAIIAHKGSESFALAIILNRSALPIKNIIILVGLFSIMTPCGIAVGNSISTFLQFKTGALIAAGFNAFAAGTFLYMSTLHHINHHHRIQESEGLLEFVFLIMGIILMALLGLWF